MKWAAIPGWENLYEVSSTGRIRSKSRLVPARNNKLALRKGRELKLVEKNNGYLCVTLTNGISRPQIAVHRIVARTFIGECPLGMHVLHSDGNKKNNAVKNLRYGTPSENIQDTAKHGRQRKGETHPGAILTAKCVRSIRKSSAPYSELAKLFGVSKAHISNVRRGRTWRHI